MDETRPLFYLCIHLWSERRNKKNFSMPICINALAIFCKFMFVENTEE